MRFNTAQLDDDEPQLNVTAMVDMVFNLLAFFVLTTSFGSERDVPVGAESRVERAATAQAGDLPDQIVIRLTPGGEGNAVRISIGQAVLLDDGFGGITAKLSEIDLPRVPVVIAADRRVSVAQVAAAMDAVLASPMKRLSLSELVESRGPGS